MPDLLIELFSEEIPARMQIKAAEDLKKSITNGLVDAGLTYANAAEFSTPRRLALSIEGLTAKSQPVREERKGPKADAPEQAIAGFLRSTGLNRDQLEEREDKKGTVLFAVIEKPGREAADIIAEVLQATIQNFPWPKSMRWGTGTLRWVRPLHSILCILSDEQGAVVVPFEIENIVAGNSTRGHRFLSPDVIKVTSFEDYEAKLKHAFVLLRRDERAETIWHDATNQAFANGFEVVEDKGLLAEVTGLVEWPVAHTGEIAEDFLDLPAEVLQTSMREHQKFFSVRNQKTNRIERFVTVANILTADDGAAILAGNTKVLSARLADAKFFWQNDLRVPLRDMAAKLASVTFHNKLGTQADRIQRIAALAGEIAPKVGADPDLAVQAAQVAKVDLSSEMVYEFPELQGVMGRYYAIAAGLPQQVADACVEHYQPLGPSDDVPEAPVSIAVALADKLDTLTGFWAIDEKPTGSKDPFALRRAALGVIRLILQGKQRLSIDRFIDAQLVRIHIENKEISDTSDSLLAFFHDRLKVYLKDKGIPHDVIDACLAMPGNDDLTLLVMRAEALAAFVKTDDGENLLQGFKRANNILKQAEKKDGVEYSYGPDLKYAEDDAEKALFAALDGADARIAPALESENFIAAMAEMAALRGPIDAFFEAVQVNDERQVVRRNRLNLLNRIREICLSVADLSRIEG